MESPAPVYEIGPENECKCERQAQVALASLLEDKETLALRKLCHYVARFSAPKIWVYCVCSLAKYCKSRNLIPNCTFMSRQKLSFKMTSF